MPISRHVAFTGIYRAEIDQTFYPSIEWFFFKLSNNAPGGDRIAALFSIMASYALNTGELILAAESRTELYNSTLPSYSDFFRK